MRSLKTLAIALALIVVLPVLLTGAATARAPFRPVVIPPGEIQPLILPAVSQSPSMEIPSPSTTERAEVIYESAVQPPRPTARPKVKAASIAVMVRIPTAKSKPKPHPKPRPKRVPKVVVVHTTGRSIRGLASWYCKAGVSSCMYVHPDRYGVADMYAAAGPGLRRAICGSDTSNCWRGRRVTVNGVGVVLADWCQCYKNRANEKLIDLYWDAWVRVPGVTKGITIRW